MMKKSYLTILAFCILLVVSGCDGSGGSNSTIGSGNRATNWLCFTSKADSSTITTKLTENGVTLTEPIPVIEYSTDNGASWKDFKFNIYDFSTSTLTSEGTTVTLAQGEKVYLRAKGKNDSFCYTDDITIRNIRFVMTGSVAASGNIMSLLDKKCALKKIPCKVCFLSLFEDCTVMTSAPELPATGLEEACYSDMFKHCTSLVSAPALPATELSSGCYASMFENCSALEEAPELPAESLRIQCYEYMFRGCTSLKSIKVYFNSWRDDYPSTADWVNGVPAGGTFYYKSGLSDLSESNNKVPSGWTKTQF